MSTHHIYTLENLIPRPSFPGFSWKGLISAWQLSAGGEFQRTAQFICLLACSNPSIFFFLNCGLRWSKREGQGSRGCSAARWHGSCCSGEGGLLSISTQRCVLGVAAHLPQHLLPQTLTRGGRGSSHWGGAGRSLRGRGGKLRRWWQNGPGWEERPGGAGGNCV